MFWVINVPATKRQLPPLLLEEFRRHFRVNDGEDEIVDLSAFSEFVLAHYKDYPVLLMYFDLADPALAVAHPVAAR